MSAKRNKFKPFPKKPNPNFDASHGARGSPHIVDIAKVREMYVEGANFRWKDFCEAHGFNPESRTWDWYTNQVNWEEWKREWVRRKNVVAEEDITPELLDCSKMIAKQRINFVKEWSSVAKNMKALLQHLMNEHIRNAAEDQKTGFTQQLGISGRKCKLNIDELSGFAGAANKIAELEARALMIVAGSGDLTKYHLNKGASDSDEENNDVLPEFQIVPLGKTMSGTERTKMLADYFDQFNKPSELPAPAETVSAKDTEDQS